MNKINNLDELKELASGDTIEVFISFGYARSSKQISYDTDADLWYIYNEIDDSEQTVKTKDLKTETNIIEALEKGALYRY